jgi:hypothetical protein
MMKLSGVKQLSSKKRQLIIGISVGVALLLIIGYGLWSVSTWSTYKSSYEGWQKDLQADVDKAIALPVATTDERAKKKIAFKNVSNEINAAEQSLCSVSNLIAWQRIISTLREREEACVQVVAQATTFGQKMRQTTTYLEYEQTLTKALTTAIAASSGKVTEATWGAQTTIWQDAGKTIIKIPTSETLFQPVRTSAIDKVKGIEVAWTELIAAHAAKDKTKYTDAQAKLAVAYEALPSLSNTSKQQFTKIAESLQKAYTELFKSKV